MEQNVCLSLVPAVPVSSDVHGRWHNDGVVGGEGSCGAVVVFDDAVVIGAVHHEQVVDNVPVAKTNRIEIWPWS